MLRACGAAPRSWVPTHAVPVQFGLFRVADVMLAVVAIDLLA